MLRLLFFGSFLLALWFGVKLSGLGRAGDVFYSICNLTEDHFFKSGPKLEAWLERCHLQASSVSSFTSDKALIEKVQTLMDEMGVSHFQIYTPAEDKQLWKSEAVDTGIRSRFVEDHLVVFSVLPKSPASEAGLRAGDDIISVNGVKEMNPVSVESASGTFHYQRGEKTFDVKIRPRALVEDMAPRLSGNVLELLSFRSEFFEAKAWRELVRKFSSQKSLIIDVRRNSGGNFVAMLRALSPFFCKPHRAGYLLQTRHAHEGETELWDKTEDEYQIRTLDESRRIDLDTYPDYGCYKGPVTVLIGPETSSVSEIFAESFYARPRSRIWGLPTSGDVVLAVWYDLPQMGDGYSVSIPEANYLTMDDRELEGKGVRPQRELYYDLKESLSGQDSWLLRAQNSVRTEK